MHWHEGILDFFVVHLSNVPLNVVKRRRTWYASVHVWVGVFRAKDVSSGASTSLCEDIAWIPDIIGVKTEISGSDLSFQWLGPNFQGRVIYGNQIFHYFDTVLV